MSAPNAPTTNGNAAPRRPLIFNAFDMTCAGHQSPGLWKLPGDRAPEFGTLKYWTDLAQLLERGKFNALFIADVVGGYDVYNGNLDGALRTGTQFAVNDPSLAVSAMAAVTKNLAFGITQSVTYEAPFTVARRFSTLDHLTEGRVAINIVTSYLDSAARNYGLAQQLPHAERYKRAEEYQQVLYKLWESSWRDDAKMLDAERDLYYNPELVRVVNHKGEYFSVSGPHIVEPSPQRTPLIFQAGTSGPGMAFATRHAEAIFVSAHDPVFIRKKVDQIRADAANLGRDPRSVKVITLLTPIIGRTEEEAQEKLKTYKKLASTEGALVLFGGWTGLDLGPFGDDEELRFVESNAVKSAVETFARTDPSVPKWTKRAVAEHIAIGGMGVNIVGTPKQVADELERWVEAGDVDGFNFAYCSSLGSFTDIVDLLFPELERRGLKWGDYPATENGTPLTARESYLGVGQKRLRDDHPASRFKWNVGEERSAPVEKGVPEGQQKAQP